MRCKEFVKGDSYLDCKLKEMMKHRNARKVLWVLLIPNRNDCDIPIVVTDNPEKAEIFYKYFKENIAPQQPGCWKVDLYRIERVPYNNIESWEMP